jgi:hypothetical protein
MLPLLFSLKGLNWWRVSSCSLAFVVVVLFLMLRMQQVSLEKAKVAYQNPLVMVQTRYIKTQGPVRIVTQKIVTAGETKIIREYIQGPTITVHDGMKFEKPILPDATKQAKRWFVGGGVLGLRSTDVDGFFQGGITLFDRVDVGAGITTDARLMVLGNYRF